MKELTGWMNNYFVIDKNKLSKEEYLVVLGILNRINISSKFISWGEAKAQEVVYVGGEGLPQYYEKETNEEEQRLLAECWEDLEKNMPKYKDEINEPSEETFRKWKEEEDPIMMYGKVTPKSLSREEAAAEEKKYGDMEKELMKRLNLRDGEDLPENYEESFIPMDDE